MSPTNQRQGSQLWASCRTAAHPGRSIMPLPTGVQPTTTTTRDPEPGLGSPAFGGCRRASGPSSLSEPRRNVTPPAPTPAGTRWLNSPEPCPQYHSQTDLPLAGCGYCHYELGVCGSPGNQDTTQLTRSTPTQFTPAILLSLLSTALPRSQHWRSPGQPGPEAPYIQAPCSFQALGATEPHLPRPWFPTRRRLHLPAPPHVSPVL